ncbi:hypothetical protein [Campylobacter sp. IFREMER_LSEM_CL2151]|uniref:hypothetical protein n=1 Tax=Campylobacter sp. IFREMER_LSEM_CL2151 TaxID=2911620 RepID=UPI0021E74113|nr:hypothetical protein [Campylobacter sp. IFREMER_LSEM_CL2151]MCV3376278.1 hypothetical protein [Campylobacter sp. IFREMER_LSEM_CL2151]
MLFEKSYFKEKDLIEICNYTFNNINNNEYILNFKEKTNIATIVFYMYNVNIDLYGLDEYGDVFSIKIKCHEEPNVVDICFNIRILKICFNQKTIFTQNNFKIYKRKFPGMIISTLQGGWGDRILSMLNAKWVANKIGFNSGFVWNRLSSEFIKLEGEKYIFSEDFISQYSYTNHKKFLLDQIACHTKALPEDYQKDEFPHKFGFYINHRQNSKDFERECPRLFSSIEFSENMKEIITKSKYIFNIKFSSDVVAIHVRSGGIVYGDMQSIYFWHYENKATPIEIAMELIEYYKDYNIVLFGESYISLKKLQEYFLKLNIRIFCIKDLIPKNYTNDSDVAMFELIFMSRCCKVVSESGFGLLASLIGNGVKSIYWREFYSNEQKKDIFEKNHNKIQVDNYQQAYSLFCYFMILRKINEDGKKLLDILYEAAKHDSNNELFDLFIVDTLINLEAYQRADVLARKLLYRSKHLDRIMFLWKNEIYKNVKYVKYPYLLYLYSIKLYSLGRMQESKNFLLEAFKLAYDEKFIVHFKKLKIEPSLLFSCLSFQTKYGTAKTRIQNQLSYKLGQAMIVNSKSILGYIRIPFVLSYIKDKHKQEQKIYQEKIKKDPSLALPPLESYPDYQEALKLKNHLSYKLGQALIKANKTWYKGGYIKMWFVIRKLKREI